MIGMETVIRKIAPNANAAFVEASKSAPSIFEANGFRSPHAQAILIAQCAHETGGFRTFSENMNYSALRLTQVWPSRFPSLASAQVFSRNPRALANKVYNGRMGNRNGTDDGFNYRGSGALQHTGRAEFERVKRRTGVDVLTIPDRLRDPAAASVMWQAACTYFIDRGALVAAEAGDIRATTLKVNGGLIGLADRQIWHRRVKDAMAGIPLVKDKTTREDADDKRKKANNAAVAAPTAGAGAGGASTGGGADYTVAIMVGLGIAVLIGLGALVLWRRYRLARKTVETLELEAIKTRALRVEGAEAWTGRI